jgi:N-acetylmuramic acid 6-phosphate etherase
MEIKKLLTEQRNPNTYHIDQLSTLEIVELINKEDQKVPDAIEKVLPTIAAVIDIIVEKLSIGGRLIYVGAGTSGRLGILDAAECPPTFGTSPNQIIGIIAGGEEAIQHALEGAEDDIEMGKRDIRSLRISDKDVVIGIAASGRTPYTISAMEEAKTLGAKVVALVCTPHSPMEKVSDYAIVVEVGPEVVTGSTRMKAGTAQKMVLNMLTTTAMIRLGKVYSNLMVDVSPVNNKLKIRAKTIVVEATGVEEKEAEKALEEYGSVKLAILSLVTGLKGTEVQTLLEKHHGFLKNAIAEGLKIKEENKNM